MRFLTVAQVAEELVVNDSIIRGLIKNRDIRALYIGRRGQWRIARDDLETYIQAGYERAVTACTPAGALTSSMACRWGPHRVNEESGRPAFPSRVQAWFPVDI